MKIYLAGPMRSYAHFNHPAFHRATDLLRDAGHEVFSPAEHDTKNGFDFTDTAGTEHELAEAGFDFRKVLNQDLSWICAEADAVVVLPGWQASQGVRAEVACALALKLPVWELGPFLAYGPESPFRVAWEQVTAS